MFSDSTSTSGWGKWPNVCCCCFFWLDSGSAGSSSRTFRAPGRRRSVVFLEIILTIRLIFIGSMKGFFVSKVLNLVWRSFSTLQFGNENKELNSDSTEWCTLLNFVPIWSSLSFFSFLFRVLTGGLAGQEAERDHHRKAFVLNTCRSLSR